MVITFSDHGQNNLCLMKDIPFYPCSFDYVIMTYPSN